MELSRRAPWNSRPVRQSRLGKGGLEVTGRYGRPTRSCFPPDVQKERLGRRQDGKGSGRALLAEAALSAPREGLDEAHIASPYPVVSAVLLLKFRCSPTSSSRPRQGSTVPQCAP